MRSYLQASQIGVQIQALRATIQLSLLSCKAENTFSVLTGRHRLPHSWRKRFCLVGLNCGPRGIYLPPTPIHISVLFPTLSQRCWESQRGLLGLLTSDTWKGLQPKLNGNLDAETFPSSWVVDCGGRSYSPRQVNNIGICVLTLSKWEYSGWTTSVSDISIQISMVPVDISGHLND